MKLTTDDTTTAKRYKYLLMCGMPDGVQRKTVVTPRPIECEYDLIQIEKALPYFKDGGKILSYTLMAVGTNDGSNKFHYKPKL